MSDDERDDWDVVATIAYDPASGELKVQMVGGGVKIVVEVDDATNEQMVDRMREMTSSLPDQTMNLLDEVMNQMSKDSSLPDNLIDLAREKMGLGDNDVRPTIYAPGQEP